MITIKTFLQVISLQSQIDPNRPLANQSFSSSFTDFASQSALAVLFYFLPPSRGGVMPLYGSRVLIWSGGGAAGRGCELVTLSLKCSFDFQRESRQDRRVESPGEHRRRASHWPESAQTAAAQCRTNLDKPTSSLTPERGANRTIRGSSGVRFHLPSET